MNAIALPHPCPVPVLESGYVTLLNRMGLLSVSGEDAVSFLHGQFSNDLIHLGTDTVRLAAYCHHQGRILALFHVWKSDDRLYLMMPRDMLAAMQKRLQLYVLRSKVRFSDESGKTAILGMGGANAEAALSARFPTRPQKPLDKIENENGVLIRAGDAFGAPRYLLVVPAERLQETESFLSSSLSVCDENSWILGDIEAGLPQITLPVQDRFIPQMVNLEQVGGLSFQKGCYPGQEVIARSQYRGTVKRRLFHGYVTSVAESPPETEVNLTAGAELFDSSGQACGTVILSARRDENRIDLLAVVQVDAKERDVIRVEKADGPVVSWVPLPYVV